MKLKTAIFILIITSMASSSFGFVEKRIQWWETRIQKLDDERKFLNENKSIDPKVFDIIDNELKRGREIVGLLNHAKKNDGALTHEKRAITSEEARAEVCRIVRPLWALGRIEHLVEYGNGNTEIASAREAVHARLIEMIAEMLGRDGQGLADRILSEDISREEWRMTTTELLYIRSMSEQAAMRSRVEDDVHARVMDALRQKSNIANGKELFDIVIVAAREQWRGRGHVLPPISADFLSRSWSWRRIESRVARELVSCRKIAGLLNDTGMIAPERLRYLLHHREELEMILFRGLRKEYAGAHFKAPAPGATHNSGLVLDVPSVNSNMTPLGEIDRIRRSASSVITGRESPRYFEEMGKTLGILIRKHTEGTGNRLFREQEKLKIAAAARGVPIHAANENDFLEAKRTFDGNLKLLELYRTRTMEFLSIVSSFKKIASDDIVDRYRYRLECNRRYLEQVRDLVAEATGTAQLHDPETHRRLNAAAVKLGGLFRVIGASLGIDRNEQVYLTRHDIAVMKSLGKEFIGTIRSIQMDVRNGLGAYAREYARAGNDDRLRQTGLDEKIAQSDIDALLLHVQECVGLLGTYRYADDFLPRYAARFESFVKQIQAGSVTPEIEYAIRMNSLLGKMEHADTARVTKEYTTKQYLRKEAKGALSRLAALIQFYHKQRVDIKDIPDPEEIESLRGRLAHTVSVGIDAWTMNEANLTEIDRKASQKLSFMLNRKPAMPADGNNADPPERMNDGQTITLTEPGVSLTLPRGFTELPVGETESMRGVIKSFRLGGTASLTLARLPLEGDGVKEAAEKWIRQSGDVLIEKRWERIGECERLWIVSRDAKHGVSETCSFIRDGYALLISGRVERNAYHSFRPRLRQITSSLRSSEP